jgi:hypothetical protein
VGVRLLEAGQVRSLVHEALAIPNPDDRVDHLACVGGLVLHTVGLHARVSLATGGGRAARRTFAWLVGSLSARAVLELLLLRRSAARGSPCAGVVVHRVRAHTPLAWAAHNNDEATTSALLRAGADPNERDADGCTALFAAAVFASEGCARALLAGGADPRLAAKDGATPLVAAVGSRRGGVIAQLFRANAPVSVAPQPMIPTPSPCSSTNVYTSL